MKLIGLTGGIACGKSTVAELFREQHITVIDCDLIAHDVVRRGRWGWRRVKAAFGPTVLLPNGEINRAKLSEIIFNDAAARRQLNRAVHLPILIDLLGQLAGNWLRFRWAVVIDMPLLFETGFYRWTGPNVVVACNENVQVMRLMARDRCSEQQARARIASQLPMEQKAQLADVVIGNDGSLEKLANSVQQVADACARGTKTAVLGFLMSPLVVGLVLPATFFYIKRAVSR